MQKIDACGMLAQWPESWGAAPKAEGPLSTRNADSLLAAFRSSAMTLIPSDGRQLGLGARTRSA